MAANKIIEGLYIGDTADAQRIHHHHLTDVIINVLEHPYPQERTHHEIWLPFARELPDKRMAADRKQLNKIASTIEENLRAGKKVLLRCAAGQERSPLAAIWFLHKKRGMQLEDAYAYVKARRPQTMWSLDWLTNK